MTSCRNARRPEPGESLDGYAAFRAAGLGLSSIKEIAEMMEIDVPGRVRISRSGADAVSLADFLDIDETEIEPLLQPLIGSRRRLFGGVALDRLHLVRNQRLFAPAALADAAYHRSAWDLRPFGASPERVSAAVAAAWRLLADWPAGFERLTADRCGRRTSRFGDGNGGATMDFLLLGDLAGTPPVLAAVAAAELVRLRGKAHETGIETVEAGTLRGLKPTDLARARRTGAIPTVFAVSGDRPVPLLHRATVETMSRRFAETTPIDVAAVYFGCTLNGIEQFIELGLIGDDDGLHAPLTGRAVRVPTASLHALADALSDRSRPDEGSWIRFGRAACAIGGFRKPYGPIIEGFLSGRMPFHLADGIGPLLERVSVPPVIVNAMRRLKPGSVTSGLRVRTQAAFVTKSDAMTELNLHVRDAGTVLVEWPTRKGAPTVPVAWLDDMCRRFITMLEVSARLGVHGHSAIRQIRSAGIEAERPHLYDRALVHRLVVGGH